MRVYGVGLSAEVLRFRVEGLGLKVEGFKMLMFLSMMGKSVSVH